MYLPLDCPQSEEKSNRRLYARRNGRLMLADSKEMLSNVTIPSVLLPCQRPMALFASSPELGSLSFWSPSPPPTQARDSKHAKTYSFSPRLRFSLFSTASRYPVVVT